MITVYPIWILQRFKINNKWYRISGTSFKGNGDRNELIIDKFYCICEDKYYTNNRASWVSGLRKHGLI